MYNYTKYVAKKVYHPTTTNDNFNSSYPIPLIFGTHITE